MVYLFEKDFDAFEKKKKITMVEKKIYIYLNTPIVEDWLWFLSEENTIFLKKKHNYDI